MAARMGPDPNGAAHQLHVARSVSLVVPKLWKKAHAKGGPSRAVSKEEVGGKKAMSLLKK